MLDKEYKFYTKNKAEFVKKYKGKFLVIKNEEVVGVYLTREDAYNESSKKYQLGTFLIQECLEEEKEIAQTFHSRVIFE